ncbi:uncharacterized protein LOC124446301 isoform X2 [Xenia sp. Carnegie-2017]|uniref:uncharacterized protein LOC124446301 isoform X2 n=1 Tax=Xenia sp. Carnegie-2017 TaxID=2897299 RepID=UPI001F03738C|nr:uncharacterized protein LOC124446301 isoform X2 [Xenia sp. Carnegie-2017]
MIFVCSKSRCYRVIFFLIMPIIVGIFSQSLPNIVTKETGTQQIFKCDVSLTGDSTVKFFRNNKKIIPSDRIKVNGTFLIMSDLKVLDGGQYSCKFDSKKTIFLGYLIVQPVKKYKFTIYPEDVTSKVTEGSNFEFRCEYGKGSTKIKWYRRRRLNGTEVGDYVPENLITIRTTLQKSFEVYCIPRVSINDAGVYRCEVDGKNNRIISSNIRILEVIERRAAKFKSVKKSFNFNETKKAEITLFVEEYPFPNITCYKDGKEIIFCIGKKMKNIPKIDSLACEQDQYGSNGVPQLIIQSISFVRDDGNYKCVATTNNPPGKDGCLLNNGGCDHLCNNTKGGFRKMVAALNYVTTLWEDTNVIVERCMNLIWTERHANIVPLVKLLEVQLKLLRNCKRRLKPYKDGFLN